MSNKNAGVSLVIIVFALMVFAILGWTLAALISGDFEANLRSLESESALNVAEAGVQWALTSYINNENWRTDLDNDSDCNDPGEWTKHTFSPGEYNVCCRNPVSGETGDAVIEVKGYVPAENNYLAMRYLKLNVSSGTVDKACMAKNLFNWSAWHSGSFISGDIVAVDRAGYDGDGYEGNNNSIHNETADLNVPNTGSGVRQRIPDDSSYQKIDMDYFKAQAGTNVWQPAIVDATIASVTPVSSTRLQIKLNEPAFASPIPGPSGSTWTEEVVLRNKRDDGVLYNKWQYKNWGVIISRSDNNTVTLEFDSSAPDMRQAGNIWLKDQQVALVKRFYYDNDPHNPNHSYNNENIWYAGGDMLLDVRDNGLTFNSTSLVAERDIVIKGTDSISVVASRQTVSRRGRRQRITYPNLATKDGNILSFETPDGHNESDRRNNRNFDGLIYTQNGTVFMNYLDGRSVMGNDITLDGLVRIQFSQRYVRDNGFIGAFDTIVWQEQ